MTETTPTVVATNVAVPQPDPGGQRRQSGIHKVPAASIEVAAPGPAYGDGSGVAGDFVGDAKHHGGQHKAVYAYSRELLDAWGRELGRELSSGAFGENLTTSGIAWAQALINQRYRVGEAVLEVADNGPGMTAEVAKRAFEPFFRVDKGRRKALPGAGLGMAIARQILDQLGGRIALANIQPRGLRQTVTLPARIA